ncbi:hypothetical protein [Parasitella parasitica]|uniref:Uncharacterized protein n=1 Tax=Parasitella parasitica TaxID=35722 RepID=A0A0B7MRE5_9FUNG|nr:hypothetical protein [Parasitella parasitica]
MGTRPHYDWSPSEALTEVMNLDALLHTSPMLSDSEQYKTPAIIPKAERLMNKGQRYAGNNLNKHLQYLLSAVFCPLDILSHELVFSESNNPNLERYCTMLSDVRKLLLYTCAAMTQFCKNIALRAVKPSFSEKSDSEATYTTLPLDKFQNKLIQHTAARKATREANVNRGQRRRFQPGNNNNSASTTSNGFTQSFFWPDPPSQQGGFPNNTYNSNNDVSFNNNANTNYSNNTNFCQVNNNNHKKSNNSFCK